MNRIQFAEIRDAFALEGMLKRKATYEMNAAGAIAQARTLRTKFRHMQPGQARDLMEAAYDVKMAEWALYETRIGEVERDPRYIAYLAQQEA